MSIVIASALSKLSLPAGSVNSTGADASLIAGTDFTSLLLSQLSADIELLGDGLPNNKTDSEDIIDTEAGAQDVTQLFAALGLAPVERSTVPVLNGNSTDTAASADIQGIVRQEEYDAAGLDRKLNSGSEDSSSIRSQTPGVDDKPAKFAVTDYVPDKTETLPVKPESELRVQAPVTHTPAQQPAAGNIHNTPLKVETPVHDRQAWANDVGQKIVWLATNDKQSAQLTLNPPQMGPIEISLNLNRDTATALFVSANPEVREALESAMPRLREMLSGAGIELGQASVSAESPHQQHAGGDNPRQASSRWIGDNAILDEGSDDAAMPRSGLVRQSGSALVDLFA